MTLPHKILLIRSETGPHASAFAQWAEALAAMPGISVLGLSLAPAGTSHARTEGFAWQRLCLSDAGAQQRLIQAYSHRFQPQVIHRDTPWMPGLPTDCLHSLSFSGPPPEDDPSVLWISHRPEQLPLHVFVPGIELLLHYAADLSAADLLSLWQAAWARQPLTRPQQIAALASEVPPFPSALPFSPHSLVARQESGLTFACSHAETLLLQWSPPDGETLALLKTLLSHLHGQPVSLILVIDADDFEAAQADLVDALESSGLDLEAIPELILLDQHDLSTSWVNLLKDTYVVLSTGPGTLSGLAALAGAPCYFTTGGSGASDLPWNLAQVFPEARRDTTSGATLRRTYTQQLAAVFLSRQARGFVL